MTGDMTGDRFVSYRRYHRPSSGCGNSPTAEPTGEEPLSYQGSGLHHEVPFRLLLHLQYTLLRTNLFLEAKIRIYFEKSKYWRSFLRKLSIFFLVKASELERTSRLENSRLE